MVERPMVSLPGAVWITVEARTRPVSSARAAVKASWSSQFEGVGDDRLQLARR